MKSVTQFLPGIAVTAIVGMAALFLSEHYSAPAMLFALLLGIALSFLYEDTKCKLGIEFTASRILRIGVALLGLRISFVDLVALGWKTALLLLIAIGSTILVGVLLAKLFGLQKRFGVLTGGAVGICGASAAMAVSSVLPESENRERDTLLTIVGVTSLSTIAMVLYPLLANWLNLDETSTSIFLGGTIHDVAQVVGAGYSVNEKTGDLATLTKLVRVSFLMPVVFGILSTLRIGDKNKAKDQTKDDTNDKTKESVNSKAPGIPIFLIAFALLMLLNTVSNLPDWLVRSATQTSRFALVISIAGIGMKSNLKKLLEVGLKPVLLLVVETVWIAGIILLGIHLI